MKKLKLELGNLGADSLTQDELKKVMGGVLSYQCPIGSKKCVTNSDCGTGEACQGIQGCCTATLGDTCTSDSTCGNNQKCMSKPVGGGKWCNYSYT